MMKQQNFSSKPFLSITKNIDVKEIERLYDEEKLTMTQIAFRFGVSYSQIQKLMRNNGIKRMASNDYRKKISDDDLNIII